MARMILNVLSQYKVKLANPLNLRTNNTKAIHWRLQIYCIIPLSMLQVY